MEILFIIAFYVFMWGLYKTSNPLYGKRINVNKRKYSWAGIRRWL